MEENKKSSIYIMEFGCGKTFFLSWLFFFFSDPTFFYQRRLQMKKKKERRKRRMTGKKKWKEEYELFNNLNNGINGISF